MPTLTEWPDFFTSRSLDVWQSLNCSRVLQPRFQREVVAMHEFAISENLIQPRLIYEAFPIAEMADDKITFTTGQELTEAASLIKKFNGAEEMILVLGTIGEKLEQTVAELFTAKKAIKALALEEVAVTAMFEFTNTILSHIDDFAAGRNRQASSPLYPGNDDFNITQQRHIHHLIGGEKIGMRVTKTDMLFPAKSASMVFALGQKMPRWDRHEDCETCKARERCRFRLPEKAAGEAA